VYNGINLNKIQLNTQTINNSFRSELGIEEKMILMGMVGNFVPGRDQMTICHLIHKLKEQYINFHFVFIGKKTDAYPELYDTCYQYCEQNNLLHQVSFLGSRNDVPLLLPQLDAFVYATDHDTFGIAVVEAMLAGVPVFVNDWEVMREISDDGKYMTLYKTKDEDDLLNQMMLFINNKSEHRKKAMLAQEYAKANFSIEKHINCLCSLYTDIINTKK
jgi:glycosyltransferase involved in cell wall biosynthesis